MSRVAELLCARRLPHAAALTLISFAVAGCSADMSTRMSQSGFSNPFAAQEATGSVAAEPVPQVERRDLPQYTRPQPGYGYGSSAGAPPVVAAPQSYPAPRADVSGGGRGIASYTPPSPPPRPRLETTGTIAARPTPARPVAAYRPPSGFKIIVGTSDTLEVLAHRYHVTPAAILAANGYRGPRALSPGQSLIIPHSAATAAAIPAAPAPMAPAVRPVAAVAAAPRVYVVSPGDTLHSIARHYHVSVAELARANNIETGARLRLGTRLTVPAKTAAVAPAMV